MRVIHVVPAVAEEASGPSYIVIRLCEGLIEAGADAHLATLDWSHGSRLAPYLTTFPLGRGLRRLGASPQICVALTRLHTGTSTSFTITACGCCPTSIPGRCVDDIRTAGSLCHRMEHSRAGRSTSTHYGSGSLAFPTGGPPYVRRPASTRREKANIKTFARVDSSADLYSAMWH